MEQIIPQVIINAAQELVAMYGNNLKYMGQCNKMDVYKFQFPDNTETGFPVLYLYDNSNDEILEISGFESFRILNELKSTN